MQHGMPSSEKFSVISSTPREPSTVYVRIDPIDGVTRIVVRGSGPGFFGNFFRGLGSVLEIMPPVHLHQFGAAFPRLSDEEFLWSDWERVGDDLRNAMDQHTEGLVHHGEQV